jgi:pyruvate dehydrogenase E2 component (dihydrolipoamide acetyltransferase)
MAQVFRLPDIGEGLAEAEIVRWLIPVGGSVAMDQPVVEVETDKAIVEIPSPYAGVVLFHGGAEGEIVEVGEVLVVVGVEGEVWPENPVATMPAPIVGTISEVAVDLDAPAAAVAGAEPGQVSALPLVRKLARELGVDLSTVPATGPGGRVTREDVLAASRRPAEPVIAEFAAEPSAEEALLEEPPVEEPPSEEPLVEEPEIPVPVVEVAEAAVAEAYAEPATAPGTALEIVLDQGPVATPEGAPPVLAGVMVRRRLSKIRRTIGANMSRSWAEIPHVTTFDEVDGERLLAAKRALGARHGEKISLDALVVKALLPVLRAHPDFFSRLEGDELVTPDRLDIGVAVDTEDGLMVVVVRDAERRSLLDLSAEIARLAERARNRQATPDELAGQSFTVSNIGAVGGGYGTPIVPFGTTAILSVGRAVERPVARDGVVTVAPMIPLSLSYDHRVIDGGAGRRFMAMVLENLEEPALFLA